MCVCIRFPSKSLNKIIKNYDIKQILINNMHDFIILCA